VPVSAILVSGILLMTHMVEGVVFAGFESCDTRHCCYV